MLSLSEIRTQRKRMFLNYRLPGVGGDCPKFEGKKNEGRLGSRDKGAIVRLNMAQVVTDSNDNVGGDNKRLEVTGLNNE